MDSEIELLRFILRKDKMTQILLKHHYRRQYLNFRKESVAMQSKLFGGYSGPALGALEMLISKNLMQWAVDEWDRQEELIGAAMEWFFDVDTTICQNCNHIFYYGDYFCGLTKKLTGSTDYCSDGLWTYQVLRIILRQSKTI